MQAEPKEHFEKLCDGVYYCSNIATRSQRTVTIEGTNLERFLNVFYVAGPLDKLSPFQVKALCQRRASLGSGEIDLSKNQEVKTALRRIIGIAEPRNLLEIGAGLSPILSAPQLPSHLSHYAISDFDNSYTDEAVGSEKINRIEFSCNNRLNYDDGFFDMMVACFVFQFNISEHQLQEICRCLSREGLIAANVYRRSNQARDALENALLAVGMKCVKLPDKKPICRENEYWIIHKDNDDAFQNAMKAKCSFECPSPDS